MAGLTGLVFMVFGAALAINQGLQCFWTQQQASIAAQEAAMGHEYVYQQIGSPFVAAIGVALFVAAAVWFCASVVEELKTPHEEKTGSDDE